ncbi:tetratricopeptide repeat protein [Photobacterium alginatilyticum]|uniref:tetratricopeptide repeat protein n=1 Tax=Photobacterium alginatilyticum TaxID=1775171 RepID=UPI00406952FE
MLAQQGHERSQFILGHMYDEGEEVDQDFKEAVKWYRLAAEQGFAVAQNNLGVKYQKGQGVGQNDQEAVKWYRQERLCACAIQSWLYVRHR